MVPIYADIVFEAAASVRQVIHTQKTASISAHRVELVGPSQLMFDLELGPKTRVLECSLKNGWDISLY